MSHKKLDEQDVRFAIYGMIGEGITREVADTLLRRLKLPTIQETMTELRKAAGFGPPTDPNDDAKMEDDRPVIIDDASCGGGM